MLKFPEVKEAENIPAPKMSLMEYAHFSVFCLENNPHITPENCHDRDTGERDIKEPFRLNLK
jgi:hypothetical protein